MAARVVFFDTSFAIALQNKDDAFHQKAVELDSRLFKEGASFVLHKGILIEIADGFAKVERRPTGIQLVEGIQQKKGYLVAERTDDLLNLGWNLFKQRPDKDWGLTDCTSFVLMEELGIQEALTADQHFVQAGYRALLLEE